MRWHAFRAAVCVTIFIISSGRPATAETAMPSINDVIRIDKGTLTEIGSRTIQRTIEAPHMVLREHRTFAQFKYSASFNLTSKQPSDLWALYFISMYDGGKVFLNGHQIAVVPTSTENTTVRNTRPYVFKIPITLLNEGANKLDVEWNSRETLVLISRAFIGPDSLLNVEFEKRYFWQNTMAQVAFVYSLAITGILMGIYAFRRNQLNYLLMGLVAVGWGIVCAVYFLPPMPQQIYPYWRLLHIVGISLITNCAWVFLIRESNPNSRFFPKLCLFWGCLGPAVYLANFWLRDVTFFPAFEGLWGGVAVAMGSYTLWHFLKSIIKKASWRNVIFFTSTSVAMLAGLADMVLLASGSSVFGNIGYSLQTVSPIWFTAIVSILVADFASSLSQQDRQQTILNQRLDTQQQELSRLYAIDKNFEREKATNDERQRIVQEMHDGLGSQLITSLAMSERGGLSNTQVTDLLRECIDDLRLSIDAMSDGSENFSVAISNLRFRTAPRLKAAGIALNWDTSRLQDNTVLQVTKTLPILRILQEALTNALKHAETQRIDVFISSDGRHLVMQITDNGRGFDERVVRYGKGISGMQKRARAAGAHFAIEQWHGTTVCVTLDLKNTESIVSAKLDFEL